MHKLITTILASLLVLSAGSSMAQGFKPREGEEHSVNVRADKKFLLIPAQDKAKSTRMTISSGDKTLISGSVCLGVDGTDYTVPIDISAFKGKDLKLTFNTVRSTDSGLGGISTSDNNPVDASYAETYRPKVHFSPYFGWTNDPNGMVYYDGEYHLSYQANPYGTRHSNMNWGHAVSKDLVHWEHHPVVVAQDDMGAIFSGSTVVDQTNSAGYGKDALIAIYTSAGRGGQRQCIAYSNDRGYTYTKIDQNPVLAEPSMRDFRDPKVRRYGDKWIMSLATGQFITFYESENLRDWTQLSRFGEDGIGGHGGVWECPDLFPVEFEGKTKWVLIVNINPGGPNGGSAGQYFIGNFDGRKFTADPLPYPLWLDGGRDNYASITFSGSPDGRNILLGWMTNWQYANDTPTVNFRNAMTVPREVSIVNNGTHPVLATYPVKEFDAAKGEAKRFGTMKNAGGKRVDGIPADGVFDLEMTLVPEASGNFGFSLGNDKGEHVDFVLDPENGKLSVNRDNSGLKDFNNKFCTGDIVSPLPRRGEYKVRLIVDRCSTEIFINGGEALSTNSVFPTSPYNALSFSGKLSVQGMTIHALK